MKEKGEKEKGEGGKGKGCPVFLDSSVGNNSRVSSSGNEFHIVGPAMKTARRPYVSSRQLGTRSCCRLAERRRSREATSETGVRWSARYRGA